MKPTVMLSCMDKRLDWLQSRVPGLVEDVLPPYTLQLAGGPKVLLDEPTRQVVIDQIKIFLDVADNPAAFTVILVSHEDCGAHGGRQTFGSYGEQVAFLAGVNQRAENVLRDSFATHRMRVEQLIVNNDQNSEVLKPSMGVYAQA